MQVAVHNPGKCGAFLRLGLVLANFVLPEGWAFANPGGYPRAFHKHRVTDSKSKHQTTYGEIYRKGKQISPFVKD